MKVELIVRVWELAALIGGCFALGFIFDVKLENPRCRSLQIIDCGHIVHNGDTIRFTTLPVK